MMENVDVSIYVLYAICPNVVLDICEAVSHVQHTVGVNKNETLVFVIFSAQDASIFKISVPIIKRRS